MGRKTVIPSSRATLYPPLTLCFILPLTIPFFSISSAILSHSLIERAQFTDKRAYPSSVSGSMMQTSIFSQGLGLYPSSLRGIIPSDFQPKSTKTSLPVTLTTVPVITSLFRRLKLSSSSFANSPSTYLSPFIKKSNIIYDFLYNPLWC